MIVDWTITVSGARRDHLLRIEFDLELGTPARISGGPSSRSVSEYDCGQDGAAAIRKVWAVVERPGHPGHARERALHPRTVMKLKEDAKLGEILYRRAIWEIPFE